MFQVVNQLEDERQKHAADTAQGDDVTYMLEKEKEKLQRQVTSYYQLFFCIYLYYTNHYSFVFLFSRYESDVTFFQVN